jgi:hypothetical protein
MNNAYVRFLLVLVVSIVCLCLGAACTKKGGTDIPASKPIMTPKEKEKVADMYQDYMTKMSPSAKGAADNVSKFKGEAADKQTEPAK